MDYPFEPVALPCSAGRAYASGDMRRYLLAITIFAIALLHIFWPNHVQLDWPTITLLAVFISLLASPELSKLLPFIKRLKLGEAEIELQEGVQRLHQDTVAAEEKDAPELLSIRLGKPNYNTYNYITPAESDRVENSILDLASRDKESAVVRITIEIEKELVRLAQAAKLSFEPPQTIRGMVNTLVSKGVLSDATAKAIIEFRDVRNKVIHPAQVGAVSESILSSAIDSGIRILFLLRNIQV